MRRWISLLFPLLLLSCSHAEKLDLGRLKLPPGFHIAIFAEAPHARMMAFSPGGALLTTETSDGKVVAFPDPKRTGHPERAVTVLDDLNAPHGIAFHNGKLYVAETNQVRRYDWDESQLRATNGQVIARLPGGGGGTSRGPCSLPTERCMSRWARVVTFAWRKTTGAPRYWNSTTMAAASASLLPG